MIENAERFFALYERDEALRERVAEAEACYPGSLEIREAVVENVLLPIAEELGLPFTVKELRAYETRMKIKRIRPEGIPEEGEEIEEPFRYWLLDYGWEENDDAVRSFRECARESVEK